MAQGAEAAKLRQDVHPGGCPIASRHIPCIWDLILHFEIFQALI
jgi:hypothetical protein